ncbi:MAG: CHASE2 domain-containing protein, partial [Geminicoccaceae bacterium]
MRELVRTGLVGIATAGVGLAFAFTQPGASLEERLGLTWLFSVRGPVETSDDVMVISLDRRSAELLDLPEKIRDWPRELYATLIERLSRDGAATISFDLIFEREREPEGDAALADAITRAGRVVLFEGLELQRQPAPATENMPLGLLETQRLRPPIEAFAEAAAGLGPFPLPIVPDRVSQVWLFQPGAGGRPTLPAVALQRHTLPVFERWLSLLKRAGADGVGALPGDAAALGKAAELRELMIGLRRKFQADPTLGERMYKAIASSGLDASSDVDASTRRLFRALTDLYDGPDSRYLNFYGPAGKITTVSLGDILGERADPAPGPWAGRSVFVGQSELYEPHNDAFITVYSRDDGVKIGGVEIAATAFANLLDGRMLEPSPYWLAAIAVFGLLIGVVAGLLPALWAVPACLLIAYLYFLGAGVAFARDAHWLPTAVPLLAELPLGLFAGLFVQYLSAKRARENLSKAIRYYLPDKLAEGFAAAPLDPLLLNEDAYAYCLITDASGFTRMAEKMTSKELKPVLEDYLGILFTAVENNCGRVTDSVGDGITAAWTTPIPDPAVAAKACKAALEIDREVQRFDQRHAPLTLPTRIGLNAG